MLVDRRDLAKACVTLVDIWLKGYDVDVSNYSQYDNGVKIIGTVTCDGKVIDKDNYQIMVDNGFYLADAITPEVSPTSAPETSPTAAAGTDEDSASERITSIPEKNVTSVPEEKSDISEEKPTEDKKA